MVRDLSALRITSQRLHSSSCGSAAPGSRRDNRPRRRNSVEAAATASWPSEESVLATGNAESSEMVTIQWYTVRFRHRHGHPTKTFLLARHYAEQNPRCLHLSAMHHTMEASRCRLSPRAKMPVTEKWAESIVHYSTGCTPIFRLHGFRHSRT